MLITRTTTSHWRSFGYVLFIMVSSTIFHGCDEKPDHQQEELNYLIHQHYDERIQTIPQETNR